MMSGPSEGEPTMKKAKLWGFLGVGALLAGLGALYGATRVEEPSYAVERHADAFELRRYEARVVAETRVSGDFTEAGNEGFRRLAGYIFGKNSGDSKSAMTAPVGQSEAGTKIAMTAPVGQTETASGFMVSFTMPAGSTLANLPKPLDERVSLRELEPTRVAVVRFRGSWSEEHMAERTEALRRWIEQQGLSVAGEPEVNRYDPPFVPWFLRRNEVWIPVIDAAPESGA